MTREEWIDLVDRKFCTDEWRRGKKIIELDTYFVKQLIILLQLVEDANAEAKFDSCTMSLNNIQWWEHSGLFDQYRIEADMYTLLEALKKAV